MRAWSSPTVPYMIATTKGDRQRLGKIGAALEQELAFMRFPEFQIYLNLENIANTFTEDARRGLNAVTKHEMGHRYCPYDVITYLLLEHAAKKALAGAKLPYSEDAATRLILNLFTDMCINTTLVNRNDEDIPWAYKTISGQNKSRVWKVYARSMEHAWKDSLLPKETTVNQEEETAAQQICELFKTEPFDQREWKRRIEAYAQLIAPFLENEEKDKEGSMDDLTQNIPSQLDEVTTRELAKRLAEIGSDGLPSNQEGLKEFKEILAGRGKGDPLEASIAFYNLLASSYDVPFATRPLGRQRQSPLQPVQWHPSAGIDALDVEYSVACGGKLIPGITTYAWNQRKREIHGGNEEVVPNLELLLDGSGSMPNPLETISLPALAGFVAARKAHRKGAQIRVTTFSGEGQCHTEGWTRDLNRIFKTLVTYFNGGTVFPQEKLLGDGDPKQVLVITDADFSNKKESADAITALRQRHQQNRVTIYALHPLDMADYLREAGAEVIHGTTPEIFKRTIGKADEVYAQ